MFVDEEDEFCMRNRGTEYIKSPEMLTLTLNSKKEADNFDRRKKVSSINPSIRLISIIIINLTDGYNKKFRYLVNGLLTL